MNADELREELFTFQQRYLLGIQERHDEGECGGSRCPFCDFEQQFQGKPFWRVILHYPGRFVREKV